MGEFIERDLGRRSIWRTDPLKIHSGNHSAEESRRQNRERIEREKEFPMSSLGRTNEQLEQINKSFKRRTRGHGRKVTPKQ